MSGFDHSKIDLVNSRLSDRVHDLFHCQKVDTAIGLNRNFAKFIDLVFRLLSLLSFFNSLFESVGSAVSFRLLPFLSGLHLVLDLFDQPVFGLLHQIKFGHRFGVDHDFIEGNDNHIGGSELLDRRGL